MQEYSFEGSQALFERAAKVIPCGIFGHYSPATLVPPTSYPFYAVKAKGAHFWDPDGNDMIDYMCAYGPMVLGYRNEVVDAAVIRQIQERGDTMGPPAPLMVELAERLVDMVPVADWAFFCKNGGDVVNLAVMTARAATGRPKIVAIEGGYHGVAAWMQGGGHHGVLEADVANVIRIPWNDAGAFERVLIENPAQIAGFLATPYHHPTFEDSVLPAAGYWNRIEALCRKNGVVLIVDDVRCGFRHDLRGTHEVFGFKPDLVCFCKAIGNGYPISALVGTEALKGDAAKVFYTGSYWYQAAPMAAALACLNEMARIDAPKLMREYGQRMTDAMTEIARSFGYHLKVTGLPAMPYVRLTDDPSGMLHQRFCAECSKRGAYFTSHHNWFISTAHTEEDLQRTLQIVEAAFTALGREGAHREAVTSAAGADEVILLDTAASPNSATASEGVV
jgi:glutamate-1-semialdehyde 2,1-aminomutase